MAMSLEEAAVAFWNVSKVFEGKLNAFITTETALNLLNQILNDIPKDHPLWTRAQDLKRAIIVQESKL